MVELLLKLQDLAAYQDQKPAFQARRESFSRVLDDWKKDCKRSEDLKEMEKFIKKNCPIWVS